MKKPNQLIAKRPRFYVLKFINRRTGSLSYRVTGFKRDGTCIKKNFRNETDAECEANALNQEYILGAPPDITARATHLTPEQLRIAETAIARLKGAHDDLLIAVDFWLEHGKKHPGIESPRLDDAIGKFHTWLATDDAPLRARSKNDLRLRTTMFKTAMPNVAVSDVTPEMIESALEKRNVSPIAKDNYRRNISRFFSWCAARPRRWLRGNPARDVHVSLGEKAPPEILTLEECENLLRAAERIDGGAMLPYTVVCLFGGLRPAEASRLTWPQINMADLEIRLESNQTKTRQGRVVHFNSDAKEQKPFNAAMNAWLEACKDKPFCPKNSQRLFDRIRREAGFRVRVRDEEDKKLKKWPQDVMRHTAISHYFRLTGSYGRAAEIFGNSESVIRKHYQSRTTTTDTQKFYTLRPMKGSR